MFQYVCIDLECEYEHDHDHEHEHNYTSRSQFIGSTQEDSDRHTYQKRLAE